MTDGRSFGKWWRLNYHFVALLLLVIGVVVLIIGSLGAAFEGKPTPGGLDFLSELAGWSYWLILLGLLAAIAGGYYVYDHFSMISEFEDIMENKSRANFLKNLDRVEELAYRLGLSYERRVVDRKNQYRLR